MASHGMATSSFEQLLGSLNTRGYRSLVDLYENAERTHTNKTAFLNYGATMTYWQVRRHSESLATMLKEVLEISRGDKVAIFMPNLMQFPISIIGIHKAGAAVININPLYTPRELSVVLEDAQPKAIIILENFAHVLAQVDKRLWPKHIIMTSVGEYLGFFKGTFFNFVLRYIKRSIRAYHFDNRVLNWAALLHEGSKKIYTPIPLTLQDVAYLQYTGGTTGVPKGAILSHGNMLANLLQAKDWFHDYYPEAGSFRIATPLPLYHIFSLTANFGTFYMLGSENLLITNPRDLNELIKIWKAHPFQVMTGVNTLFNSLINHPDFKNVPHNELKIVLGGGMAVLHSVANRWQEITGNCIIQAYGLTEASPAITINPLNSTKFTGSIGLPLTQTSVSIRDDSGNELDPGSVGEIWVKGPQVMVGYFNKPKETSETITEDGWLKTGDLGTQDAQGYIWLVDRKKDMLKVSGFNVYPFEIEEILSKHPAVLEVAVIGIPDQNGGDMVKAFIVLKAGALFDSQALTAYCRELLTPYKVPKIFEVIQELPKSPVGKILKRSLRLLSQ